MPLDPGLFDFREHIGKLASDKTVQAILFWQVLGQVFSALLAPANSRITQEVFSRFPVVQLSVADAVDAVIKSHRDQPWGEAEAKRSGIDPDRFRTLLDSAGEPPGLDFLTEAWRRKFIPQAGSGGDAVSLEQGIRESRLKNKWIPTVEQMQYRLPPVGTLIEGWLRAQIEEVHARELLRQNGVDDETASIMYKSAGRPPGPMELIELHRRGVIPEAGEGGDTLSLRQGYLETDLKNKWYQAWLALAEYLPPPRTVTALLRQGSITPDEALIEFKKAGLSEHMAAIYVAAAHHEKTHAARELTKADTLALFAEGVFDRATALDHLHKLGHDAATAEFELEVAEFHRVKGLIDRALARIHNLYVTHKLDKAGVLSSLIALEIPEGQRPRLLQVWDLERADNARHLTAAEIGHLVKLEILDEGEGLARLEADGYSPTDAWLRLALALGGAPKTAPPVA